MSARTQWTFVAAILVDIVVVFGAILTGRETTALILIALGLLLLVLAFTDWGKGENRVKRGRSWGSRHRG